MVPPRLGLRGRTRLRPADAAAEPVVRAGALETSLIAELGGGPLPVLLRRSPRARRLRLVVDHRRGVVVTVPLRRGDPLPEVERFVAEREAWIRRHLGRHAMAADRAPGADGLADGALLLFRGSPHRLRVVPADPGTRRSTVAREGAEAGDELVVRVAASERRALDRILREWLVERARTAIDGAVLRHAPALGVSPAAVSLRDTTSRWGSASRRGRLSFSWRLILAPDEALDTVVIHELAHLRVFGHGPEFWALVATRRPDHAAWRRWLRRHAAELHATLA